MSELPELTQDEMDVLRTFIQFLMPKEQMLCLGNADVPATRIALEQLISRGLLTATQFKGGYCLTAKGFWVTRQMVTERVR